MKKLLQCRLSLSLYMLMLTVVAFANNSAPDGNREIRELALYENKRFLEHLYADISGFQGVDERENAMIIGKGGAPTYGEITYESLQAILDDLPLGANDVWYDLGSGVGKTVVQVAMNTPVKRAVGIELSPTRYQGALRASDKCKNGGHGCVKKMEFVNDDFLNVNMHDATVVYTCATCFSHECMTGICRKLSLLKPGLTVLTLKELPNYALYGFKLVKEYYLPMTWTLGSGSHVYRYELVS